MPPAKPRFIDTNVFLRFLTADLPEPAERCAALVQRLRDGEEVASISPLAVAEIIWTLKADAGISRFHPNPRRSRLSRWITASICSSSSRGRDVPSSIRLSEKSPAIEASTVVKG